jgi:NADPH:quinone reductase-like Zn-dependent oxidoreductase
MTGDLTMRGFVLNGHGGLDMLEYRDDLLVPAPAANELVIEVAACGMNNTDVNTRTGWYADGGWGGDLVFPVIQGADPAGRVVSVGSNVDPVRIGERVLVDAWIRSSSGELGDAVYLGSERDGGYAEYVAVPSVNAHLIETDLTYVELASFPCSYGTAEHMLHRANVVEGQWVLVTGASGGVGNALVQLAKRRGANVVALTSVSKIDDVAYLGADVVLDRSMDDVGQTIVGETGGVDVFADVVGGDLFAPLFETIKPGGHYTTAGAIGGPVVSLDLRTLYLKDITMHGATVLPPIVFQNLISYIERAEIRPVVAATYPLEHLTEAQAEFIKKEHVGTFVIEIRDSP